MAGYLTETRTGGVSDARVTVVASRFHQDVVDGLLAACLETLRRGGLRTEAIHLVRVPGAFEIPAAVKHVLDHSTCDAVITLGAVIRGETPHFEYIASACAHALAELAIAGSVPIIFGVLTTDDLAQAKVRSSTGEGGKGAEAARAALEMIGVFRTLAELDG